MTHNNPWTLPFLRKFNFSRYSVRDIIGGRPNCFEVVDDVENTVVARFESQTEAFAFARGLNGGEELA